MHEVRYTCTRVDVDYADDSSFYTDCIGNGG